MEPDVCYTNLAERGEELGLVLRLSLHEANMRALFALLALLGLVGVVSGIIIMIQGAQGEPFSFENYGGPGPIIGGLLLTAVSLYLFLNWPRFESSSREVHRR